MAFFVEESSLKSPRKNSPVSDRVDLEWIAVGKRAGLSLKEINELRIRDLAAFVEIYTGADKNKPRQATQEDIDSFYAG